MKKILIVLCSFILFSCSSKEKANYNAYEVVEYLENKGASNYYPMLSLNLTQGELMLIMGGSGYYNSVAYYKEDNNFSVSYITTSKANENIGLLDFYQFTTDKYSCYLNKRFDIVTRLSDKDCGNIAINEAKKLRQQYLLDLEILGLNEADIKEFKDNWEIKE